VNRLIAFAPISGHGEARAWRRAAEVACLSYDLGEVGPPGQQAVDALAKVGWLGDQTEHEMAFARKIIEVAGMRQYRFLPQ